MLKVNANFQRKECQLRTDPCVVEKIISLPSDEYNAFCIKMSDAADRIISEGISSSVNGGKYLTYGELLDYVGIDIEFEESAADLLFEMLRGRKEVTTLFFDKNGIGIEFDPACCTSQIKMIY